MISSKEVKSQGVSKESIESLVKKKKDFSVNIFKSDECQKIY